MNRLKQKIVALTYAQNWNIGFPQCSTGEMLDGKPLGTRWLRHNYKDRFFADPFIAAVSDTEIELLVEELIFAENKGRIVALTVSRKDYRLVKRREVLELDTHLSYPALIDIDGKCYMYPENSAAGELNIYEYDAQSAVAHKVKRLCQLPLADATIFPCDDGYSMLATVLPEHGTNLKLFKSPNPLTEEFTECGTVWESARGARSAGLPFEHEGTLYRPAQNCAERYGGSLIIEKTKGGIPVAEVIERRPESFRYNLGLHTFNTASGISVIDGFGYLNPIAGRTVTALSKLHHAL